MNFSRALFYVFAVFLVCASVMAAPEPRWKIFKKIEKVGQNIRDGIIKAGPAVAVVGQAATIAHGK
ncbi:cecropin [Bombyx mandarina]|uniref:Cecropin E n=4 Tax=Bombyx TaxID=7090 RepID=Q308S4_BOMMO|nr:cecropin precursor [Bombyx mori]XP_028043558.1 cecropin [Bombyx mandarina]ABB19289.1 cecropin E [Bombyx mori]